MACSFLIDREILKEAKRLINEIMPIDSHPILMNIRKKEAVIKVGCPDLWLEQIIPLKKVNQQLAFVIQSEKFKRILNLGKFISFDINKNSAIVESERFRGKFPITLTNNLKQDKPKEIKITHKFPLEAFNTGLNLVTPFDNGDDEFLRLMVKDKNAIFMIHDRWKGIFYKTKSDAGDFDLTFDIKLLTKILPSIKGKSVGFGISICKMKIPDCKPYKMARVHGNNIDLYFKLKTDEDTEREDARKIKIQDVKKIIDVLEVTSPPKFSFKIDAKNMMEGIKIVSSLGELASSKDIKIKLNMKKGENGSQCKLESEVTGGNISYTLPIDDLNASGIAYITDIVLDGATIMKGLLHCDFYQKSLIIRSLDDNKQTIMPVVIDKKTRGIIEGKKKGEKKETCSFSINMDSLKTALKRANNFLPTNINQYHILMEIKNKEAVIKVMEDGIKYIWLEQNIPLEKVNREGCFVIGAKEIIELEYPGITCSFDVRNNQDKGVKIISGPAEFSLISTLPEKFPENKLEEIEITHKFPLETFIKGIKLLAFDPIKEIEMDKKEYIKNLPNGNIDEIEEDNEIEIEKEGKFIRIIVKNKRAIFICDDEFRGAFYETKCNTEDLDLTFECSYLIEALSFIADGDIGLGYSKRIEIPQRDVPHVMGIIKESKQTIRICGENIDLYFPLITKEVNKVKNIKQIILKTIKKEKNPQFSFEVDAKKLAKSIKQICDHPYKSEPVQIFIHLIKGSKEDQLILKLNYDLDKIYYNLPIDDLNSSGLFFVWDRVLKDILLLDGRVQCDFYKENLIISNLDYNMQIIIPLI